MLRERKWGSLETSDKYEVWSKRRGVVYPRIKRWVWYGVLKEIRNE